MSALCTSVSWLFAAAIVPGCVVFKLFLCPQPCGPRGLKYCVKGRSTTSDMIDESTLCTSASWLCTFEVDGLLQVFILVDRRDLVFTGNASRQLVELPLLVCLCQKSFVRFCGFRFSISRSGPDIYGARTGQRCKVLLAGLATSGSLSWQPGLPLVGGVCARSHSSPDRGLHVSSKK